MKLMTNIIGLLLISLFSACGVFDSDNDSTQTGDKVYVALQGLDQVGIVDIVYMI